MQNENENVRGFLSTKELADRCGLRRYQLEYLIDNHKVPDARQRISNRRMFSMEEVQVIESLVRAMKSSGADATAEEQTLVFVFEGSDHGQ